MTDVVERLLAGAGGGKHWMDLHTEAAHEITRLRAALTRIAYLQMDICSPPLRSVEETMRLIAKDALNPPVGKGEGAQG